MQLSLLLVSEVAQYYRCQYGDIICWSPDVSGNREIDNTQSTRHASIWMASMAPTILTATTATCDTRSVHLAFDNCLVRTVYEFYVHRVIAASLIRGRNNCYSDKESNLQNEPVGKLKLIFKKGVKRNVDSQETSHLTGRPSGKGRSLASLKKTVPNFYINRKLSSNRRMPHQVL